MAEESELDHDKHLRDREHVLSGIVRAQQEWAQALSIVSGVDDADSARETLKVALGLDDIQAAVVLDLQFRRVSRLEQERVREELADVRRQLSSST